MKIGVLLLFLSLVFVSCSGKKQKIAKKSEIESPKAIEDAYVDYGFNLDTLRGIYDGDFDNGEIRIVLNMVSENHAVGYNLHRGIQRNISGTLEQNEKEVLLTLAEPGDHPYDGVFKFSIDKATLKATGIWWANDTKIGKKQFSLEKLERTKTHIDAADVSITQINNRNFADYFYYASSEVGNFSFNESGSCQFNYYPTKDEISYKDQLVTLHGDWSVKDGEVTVFFNEEGFFPNKQAKLQIEIDAEYGYMHLKYKDMTFYVYEDF